MKLLFRGHPEVVDADLAGRYNNDHFAEKHIIRVVSAALQRQRFATGRDGTVWPATATFDVHCDDGEVSTLNLRADEISSWAAQHDDGPYRIEAICDEEGYVIWPFRDGSRILWR